MKLGADLNRVRQQVIVLLHHPDAPQPSHSSGLGRQGETPPIDDAFARMDALERRLAAIELWAGMRPDLSDVDHEIARVQHAKDAAIDSQDFEAAVELRNQEVELLTRRLRREEEWAADTGARASVAAEFARVNAELERIRTILRRRGPETGNDVA